MSALQGRSLFRIPRYGAGTIILRVYVKRTPGPLQHAAFTVDSPHRRLPPRNREEYSTSTNDIIVENAQTQVIETDGRTD